MSTSIQYPAHMCRLVAHARYASECCRFLAKPGTLAVLLFMVVWLIGYGATEGNATFLTFFGVGLQLVVLEIFTVVWYGAFMNRLLDMMAVTNVGWYKISIPAIPRALAARPARHFRPPALRRLCVLA